MKNEKFAEVYNKHKKLVMQVLMNRCKDEQAAQELCQAVFKGYYLRMETVADDLIKSWLMWFASMESVRYQERQKGAYVSMSYRGSQKDEAKVRQTLDILAKKQGDVRIAEELKGEHEEWYKMMLLASVFGLDDEELAEYLKIHPQELRKQLFNAKKYLVDKYIQDFKREYKKLC